MSFKGSFQPKRFYDCVMSKNSLSLSKKLLRVKSLGSSSNPFKKLEIEYNRIIPAGKEAKTII